MAARRRSLGAGEIELSELLGARFEAIGGAFHSRGEIRALLHAGGFRVVDERERGHVAGEADTRRLYVLAAAIVDRGEAER